MYLGNLSASFEYLCYGSTVIINTLIFHRGDRQNLTSKVGPRVEGVKSRRYDQGAHITKNSNYDPILTFSHFH